MNQIDIMLEPVRAVLLQFGAFLPRLLLAAIILLIGWVFAKAIRLIVIKALRAVNFNVLTERAGIDRFLHQGGIKTDMIGILGALIYWLVTLAVLMIAFNSLGLTNVTELIGRVALFIPKVIVAVLILAFGAYFARFIDNSIIAYGKNVGLEDAEFLGRFARYAVLIFVVMIALEQVNVASELVRQSFLIILAGVVFALALAFGLGSQHRIAELLDKWWPAHRSQQKNKE
ncbi:MAG TPA: hypothetical protein VK959_12210 [Methylophilaceae bacterium]|jgi:hypothetical protein|nr:hypothetical protein [Methylophilaceae bacterium]